MPESAEIVAANYRRVLDRINDAANRAGRSPDDVTLVGVTKYVDAPLAALLLEAGCTELGESRPQQLWEKAANPKLQQANWHLVGHLQTNKIRRSLPLVSLIHSVDSVRLLTTVNDEAAKIDRTMDVLLEVNTSGETAKHGLSPRELPEVLDSAASYQNVHICGLMSMAALEGGLDVARKNFAQLRQLRDQFSSQLPLPHLSMGMSRDFEEAILEGATLLRIGSTLWEGVR